MILNHLITFEEARWSSLHRLILQAYSSGQRQMLVFHLPDQSPSHCTKDPRIHNLCYTWLKFYDMTELKKNYSETSALFPVVLQPEELQANVNVKA